MMVVEYLSSKVFQIQIPTDFRGLIKWSPDEFLALSGDQLPIIPCCTGQQQSVFW